MLTLLSEQASSSLHVERKFAEKDSIGSKETAGRSGADSLCKLRELLTCSRSQNITRLTAWRLRVPGRLNAICMASKSRDATALLMSFLRVRRILEGKEEEFEEAMRLVSEAPKIGPLFPASQISESLFR